MTPYEWAEANKDFPYPMQTDKDYYRLLEWYANNGPDIIIVKDNFHPNLGLDHYLDSLTQGQLQIALNQLLSVSPAVQETEDYRELIAKIKDRMTNK